MLTPAAPRFRARVSLPGWKRWLPAAAFLLYALLLACYMGAYAGGSDQSGYLNNARLLAKGHVTAPMRILPGLEAKTLPLYTYVPLGFIPDRDRQILIPTYPMGLPLLIMGMAQITGWEHAPGLVLGLHALLGLWLVLRLAHAAGLETGWAWLGALMLATSPLYLLMSLQVMSDVPALVWVTAAVYFAWISRERTWLALPAGMALAMAVLVRPTDLLALVPVAMVTGLSWRRWVLLALGALPGACFQGGFNLIAYGQIFTTGYGYISPSFSLANVPATLLHYAVWLPVVLTPLCLLALGLPALWRRQPRAMAVLAAWVLVFLVFYLFYLHTHQAWGYLRFLLPAFPSLIVATLLVARTLLGRFRLTPRPWWLAAAGAAILAYGISWSRHFDVFTIGHGEKVYPETTAWLRTHLPPNAVIASMQTTGALLYYTKFTFFRWDMMPPESFQRIAAACAAAGRPIYATLYPFEIEEKEWAAFEKHLTGRWTRIGAVRHVSIWRYDPSTAP
ncbi:MAG: hypothetical protein PHE83_12495 [Opitutaceae bacterium]|nr:hypothetical protein [Opitutaceae bacterium]